MPEETSDDGLTDTLSTLAGGAGLIFGGRVIKILFRFLTQLVMARLLGAELYGSVILATISIGGIAGLFVRMGLPAGLQRKIPYYEDEPKKARGVVKASGQIATVTSVLGAGVVFLAAPWISVNVFNDADIALLLRIGAVGLPFIAARDIGVAAAKASRDAVPEVIVKHIVTPVSNTALIALFIVLGYSAAGAMVGDTLSTMLGAIVALYLTARSLRFSIRGPTERMHTEVFQFSLPLMLSAGASLLIGQTDTFLLGALLDSETAGIYNIAFQFFGIGLFFFYAFAYLLPPILARLDKQGEYRNALRMYQVATKWMVFTTLPVVIGLVLFPGVILTRVFGAGYAGGAMPLRILMLPVLVTAILGPNGRSLVSLGYNKLNLYVNGGVGLSNVVLNLVLIPEYGAVGAAAATATSFVARDVIFSIVMYRREGMFGPTRTMLRTVLATALIAAVGYVLFVQSVTVTFLSALAWGVVFLGVYAVTVVLVGGVESEDERMLSLFEDRIGVELTGLRSVVTKLQ